MPLYEYKCKGCGETILSMIYGQEGERHLLCGGEIKRVFSFSYHAPMPDHFNVSTGTYVRNEANLKDDFKRMSEDATEYTGIEHNFQPIDLQDRDACGVTDEGLDATYDRAKAEGRPTFDPTTLD